MIRTLLATAALAAALPLAAHAGTVVPLAHFTKVALHGGGHVVLRHGDTQQVTIVNGSMQYTSFIQPHPGELQIEACNESCPHHYDLEIEVVSPDVDSVAVADGGEIAAQGDFPKRNIINVGVREGGAIDARALRGDMVNAAVDQGGSIKVAAASTLNAAINQGGLIRYWGDPVVNQAVHEGGSIQHASHDSD